MRLRRRRTCRLSHTGEESWDGLRAFSAAGFTTARDRAGATAVYGSATSSRTQCTRLAGDLRTEVKIDDQASGLGWMPDGSLLVVSMTKRQVLRRSLEGKIAVHADLSHIAGGPCNDMVVDSKGRAYVGNFGYDLYADKRSAQAIIADHPTAKLACVTPDGSAQVAAEDIDFPNGTVITPDGKTLIIGETFGGRLTAFDIGADGSLGNRRVWAATSPRMPDGIALDAKGRVWMALEGRPLHRSRRTGRRRRTCR